MIPFEADLMVAVEPPPDEVSPAGTTAVSVTATSYDGGLRVEIAVIPVSGEA